MRLRYQQVDAFAEAAFQGNPAAVVALDHWPEDARLQAIAAETGLPATAFVAVSATDGTPHALRWFGPRAELAMCGHATLATAHALITGEARADAATLRFETRRAGMLTVTRVAPHRYTLDLPALRATPAPLPAIAAALRLAAPPVETLWHPLGYALLRLADAAAVRAVRPDPAALRAAAGTALTVVTAPGDTTDMVSRAFAPASGLDEDPATGSAHALLAPYWAARLGRETLRAEQASARGARIACRVAGDRVALTGGCVTVVEGWLRV